MQAVNRDGASAARESERDAPAAHVEALIERFGALMLATARRWSTSDQDAEDAFQRAAELALRNLPTGSDDEVRGWLRTTVKNEARAIRRQSLRIVAGGAPESLPEQRAIWRKPAPDSHARLEQLERLRLGGAALARLKPQEVRALQLQAEGYSYREIGAIEGWTFTKVNRCITEGRRAFEQHLRGIEAGSTAPAARPGRQR